MKLLQGLIRKKAALLLCVSTCKAFAILCTPLFPTGVFQAQLEEMHLKLGVFGEEAAKPTDTSRYTTKNSIISISPEPMTGHSCRLMHKFSFISLLIKL